VSSSYLKSLQLAKQLEERAKEALRTREQAEQQFKAAEELLDRGKRIDADLAGAQRAAADYTNALTAKDYKAALGHATKAAELAREAVSARIAAIVASASSQVALVEEAGKEAKGARELLTGAQNALASADFDGALKQADEAWKTAAKLLHEYFSESISEAQGLILQAQDLGKDTKVFEDLLARARSAVADEEFSAALGQMQECLQLVGEDLGAEIRETQEGVRDLVEMGEELGADLAKARDFMERSTKSLDSWKYAEASNQLRRAETEAERVVSPKFHEAIRQLKEDLRAAKKIGREPAGQAELIEEASAAFKHKHFSEASRLLSRAKGEVSQTSFQIVLEAIQRSRDKFVLAKKVGLDLSEPMERLNRARESLKGSRFEEALAHAEGAGREIEKAVAGFNRARDHIAKLADTLRLASEIDAELASAKQQLTRARAAFESKDYEGTDRAATDGIAQLERQLRAHCESRLAHTKKLLGLARGLRAEVESADGELARAETSLAEGALVDGARALQSAQAGAEAALTAALSERIANTEAFLTQYQGEADLTPVQSRLTAARTSLQNKDFAAALQSADDVSHELEVLGREETERLLQKARAALADLKSADVATDDLQTLLDQAEERYSSKLVGEVPVLANEIITRVEEKGHQLLQTAVSSIKDTIEEGGRLGLDIAEARLAVKEARELAETRWRAALEKVLQAKRQLHGQIERHFRIKELIVRGLGLVEEAKRSRVDVSAQSRRLDQASAAFDRGLYDEAERTVGETLAELESAMGLYLSAKLILAGKEVLEFCDEFKIEAAGARAAVDRAKEHMRVKRYDQALAAGKEAEAAFLTILAGAAETELRAAQIEATQARDLGIDTLGAEKLLEKAEGLLKSNAHQEALRTIRVAREEVDQVRGLSSQAALEIKAARDRLREAELLGVSAVELKGLLDQATEALEKHQYAIAQELARKAAGQAGASSQKEAERLLGVLKGRREKSGPGSLERGVFERALAAGREHLRAKQYAEVFRSVAQSESELEQVELQRDMSAQAVAMARSKLEMAAAEGIRSPEAQADLEAAEAALRDEHHVDAIGLAIRSGDNLHQVQERMEELRLALKNAEDRIRRLERVGIDAQICRGLLEEAHNQLFRGDLAVSRQSLDNCVTTATELFEESVRKLMEEGRTLVEELRKLGVDPAPYLELLRVAERSYDDKLWDFAFEQAQQARDASKLAIQKKLDDLRHEVVARIEFVKGTGAATKSVEDLVLESEDLFDQNRYAEAFAALMRSDEDLHQLEGLQKRYLDSSYAAESAIANARRYGVSTKDIEKLIRLADLEREKDYEAAIDLLAEAAELAKTSLDKLGPQLAVALGGADLVTDTWGTIPITVSNESKSLAKDVRMSAVGDFESKPASPVGQLRGGDRQTISLEIKPRRAGLLPIRIQVTFGRLFDEVAQTVELEEAVQVSAHPKEFIVRRAAAPAKCAYCYGRIKPDFEVVSCLCGAVTHLNCAQRNEACPNCGRSFAGLRAST